MSRHPDDIARYFTGLDLIEPGVISSSRWRPTTETLPDEVDVYCGVARKP
ncbi:SAM-dependent methyltransferase [Actinoplanes sp. NPDC051633]